MKITFVGTSHGVPSNIRHCTCIMIESGGSIYYIDAGAPVIDMLLRAGKNINDFRAMFTTHVHGDHTAGLWSMLDLMFWYFKDSSGDFFITSEAQITALKNLLVASETSIEDSDRVRLRLATAGVVYADENIRVQYIPTKHTAASYAVLVTEGERRVLFGGDFSQNLSGADVPDVIKEDIDAFVCEMAHITAQNIEPHLDRCRAKKVFFTHVFPLEKYSDIKSFAEKYDFEILTPSDGDSFVI